MVDTPLSGLTALTGANLVTNDLFLVSDVSAGAAGSKKMTSAELLIGLLGNSLSPVSNILEQRNGTSAQTYRLFNTWTDASNGEWLELGFTTNVPYIQASKNGSGTYRNLDIKGGSVASVITFDFANAMLTMPNAWALNTLNETRIASGGISIVEVSASHGLWVDGAKAIGFGSIGIGADSRFTQVANGILGVRPSSNTTGGALNFLEQTAPAAPSANQVSIYAEDNGSGKTRLMARFNTGAAVQFAIEP